MYIKSDFQAMREQHQIAGTECPKIGPFKLTGQILKQDGIGGLFRGLKPTFAREMPGYFFFFYAYEFTREVLTPEGKTKDDLGPLGTVCAGAIAGKNKY